VSGLFGPFGRFRLEDINSEGELAGHELWDAERPDAKGHATLIRRFKFAADAFDFAATLVAPADQDATSRGLRVSAPMTEPNRAKEPTE
jgi:hypothetical protein